MRSLLISSALASFAAGSGFDFRGCNAGSGEFSVYLDASTEVYYLDGFIPSEKAGVRVWLVADADLDVQVYDMDTTDQYAEGKAIVGYCEEPCNIGQLAGPGRDTTSYNYMAVTYSGYNGVDGQLGSEEILIDVTSVNMKMGVLPYESGAATVYYTWDGDTSACCSGADRCYGSFTQQINEGEIVNVGEIEVGVGDLQITLTSDVDIDVSLYDLEDTSNFGEGKAIVGYCDGAGCNAGFLMEGYQERYDYKGNGYTYSGYNGKEGGGLGDEYIYIEGSTNTLLMMSAYGYEAGYAVVDYSYTRNSDYVYIPTLSTSAPCASSLQWEEQCRANFKCIWNPEAETTCEDYSSWLEEQCSTVSADLYTVCKACAAQDYGQMQTCIAASGTRAPCLALLAPNMYQKTADFVDCIACDATDQAENLACMYRTVANPVSRCIVQTGDSREQCFAIMCTDSSALVGLTASQDLCLTKKRNLQRLCFLGSARSTALDVRECVVSTTTGLDGSAADLSWVELDSICQFNCVCDLSPDYCCAENTFDTKCRSDAASQCGAIGCDTQAAAPTAFANTTSGSGITDLCTLMPSSQRDTCKNCALDEFAKVSVNALTKCIEKNLITDLCKALPDVYEAQQTCLNCQSTEFSEANTCVNSLIVANTMACMQYSTDLTSNIVGCLRGSVADSAGAFSDKCPIKSAIISACDEWAQLSAQAILGCADDTTDSCFFNKLRLV